MGLRSEAMPRLFLPLSSLCRLILYASYTSPVYQSGRQQRRHYDPQPDAACVCRSSDEHSDCVSSVVRSSVFPVEPGGAQKVRITYEHVLPADGDRIDYALPRTESIDYHVPWKVTARIKSKSPIILFSLVDNACKYAAPTASEKLIHLEALPDGKFAMLRVRDHGQGISAEGARRLFQPFSKSAHEAAHTAPGVGLGLALCRRLSRSMGGDLRLEALVKGGACFVLTLPMSHGGEAGAAASIG